MKEKEKNKRWDRKRRIKMNKKKKVKEKKEWMKKYTYLKAKIGNYQIIESGLQYCLYKGIFDKVGDINLSFVKAKYYSMKQDWK